MVWVGFLGGGKPCLATKGWVLAWYLAVCFASQAFAKKLGHCPCRCLQKRLGLQSIHMVPQRLLWEVAGLLGLGLQDWPGALALLVFSGVDRLWLDPLPAQVLHRPHPLPQLHLPYAIDRARTLCQSGPSQSQTSACLQITLLLVLQKRGECSTLCCPLSAA